MICFFCRSLGGVLPATNTGFASSTAPNDEYDYTSVLSSLMGAAARVTIHARGYHTVTVAAEAKSGSAACQ